MMTCFNKSLNTLDDDGYEDDDEDDDHILTDYH